MGVGEDDSLEDAVSVTIIATGFNAEQQNEISNTETKKIIHTLEDEQKAVQDLSAKKTSTPTMPRPVVNETPEPPKPTKIVHVLEDDVTEPAKPKMDLVQTTNSIKNIDVIYEEVKEVLDAPNHIEDEEFIIVETTDHIKDMRVVDAEEVKNSTTTTETEEEDQFTFSFDFPINSSKETAQTQPEAEEEHEEPVVFNLTEDTNNARNIEVKESIEIIPVTETTSGGTTRYSLDDYMDLEDELEQAKPVAKKEEEVEESLRMETKTVKAPETTPNDNDEDPFNQPISKDLIDRAAERRAKMKEFNYKFRSSTNHIDEIEKQPAYKRAGVDLERKPEDSKLSRTTLNTDEDEITLRSNNSFLHDNVD